MPLRSTPVPAAGDASLVPGASPGADTDETASVAPAATVDTSPASISAMIAAGAAALHWPTAETGTTVGDDEHALLLLSLTHDLKSPLGGLMLALDQLRSGQAGPLTGTQERVVARALSAAHSMAILIGTTGDVAARGATLANASSVFSLRESVDDVRASTRALFEEKRLYLRVSIECADLRCGSPLVFHRVLLNLVVNAVKFTDQGGVTVTVAESDPGQLTVQVLDTGMGLGARRAPAEALPADGAHAVHGLPHGPSGVGLHICERLLQHVGGSLTLTPAHAGGTRVTFTMPLARAT